MFEGSLDGLRELFDALFDKTEQLVEEIKRIIVCCDNRREKRLASRKGWDKPAHLVPSGAREATEARNAAAVTRWHTAATGE